MSINSDVDAILAEIARFYNDSQLALDLLRKHACKCEMTLDQATHLKFSEESLYKKRVANKIPRKTHLLMVNLDTSPLQAKIGHTAGAPAYQAEIYYRGSS